MTVANKPGAPAIGCTHLLLLRSAKTDSLAGGELAEDGLMTMAVGLGRFGDRRLEKGGRYCMRPSFVGLVPAFGGLPGTEHGRFGSRVFCATRG
jgi:hypothetical protein